jgi:hypothetical protein
VNIAVAAIDAVPSTLACFFIALVGSTKDFGGHLPSFGGGLCGDSFVHFYFFLSISN